jgi:hypothetical protein
VISRGEVWASKSKAAHVVRSSAAPSQPVAPGHPDACGTPASRLNLGSGAPARGECAPEACTREVDRDCVICPCNGCGQCFRQTNKSSSFEPAYFAGPDSPAVLFAAGSIVASVVKAALIRSTSASDISSRLMKELRAAALTRISSSNLSCMACVSRV